jgi:hypothetical protein
LYRIQNGNVRRDGETTNEWAGWIEWGPLVALISRIGMLSRDSEVGGDGVHPVFMSPVVIKSMKSWDRARQAKNMHVALGSPTTRLGAFWWGVVNVDHASGLFFE